MSIRTIINLITTSIVTSVMAVVTFAPDQAEAARAFIVFGDSLVDSGNNNYLATTACADSPPYGIDHPTHRPTGRFSNGLNLPDIVGQKMGWEPILLYLSPQLNGEGLLHGANFASAGVGILNETGFQFANVLTISRQFELFQQYQQRVSDLIGPDQSKQLVNNALVLITLGGNDFINNYFSTPFSARRSQFTIPDYCRYLVSEYRKILQKLYKLGARRVLVTGIGALGCVPGELAMSFSMDGNCVTDQQKASTLFNPALDQILQDLNCELGSDVFIFVNAFAINTDMMDNPQKYGFTASKMACCGQGMYNGIGSCNRLLNLCPDRDLYVFWDSFHPTERALHVIVEKLLLGSNEYMKPMNLSTIMALDAETIN